MPEIVNIKGFNYEVIGHHASNQGEYLELRKIDNGECLAQAIFEAAKALVYGHRTAPHTINTAKKTTTTSH